MKFLTVIITLILCNFSNAQSENDIQTSVNYLKQNHQNPNDYVLSKFKNYNVIFLGEDHRVRENVEFVNQMIPNLYKNGIYNLGVEFGASEHQSEMDSLINAPKYDESRIRKMMFDYNSGWAYKEYMDLYKAAWTLNKSLSKTSKKFRIINLSYQYDWSSFSGQKTPENMRKVFHKGNTETFRTAVVKKEIIAKNEKILILTGLNHAFTKYRQSLYDYTSPNFVRFEDGYFGNLVYNEFPEKVFTIILHRPLYNYPNLTPYFVSPGNGMIEKIMATNNNRPSGFDLAGTPLGKICDNSSFSMGYKNFQLSDLMDGYIFLKPLSELSNCTIDEAFFQLIEQNWDEAMKTIPDPTWTPKPTSAKDYWNSIKNYSDVKSIYKNVH